MSSNDGRFVGKLAHIGVDAVSGPTDWAGRSIKLERLMGMDAHAPAPPASKPHPARLSCDATSGATVDATSGATPSNAASSRTCEHAEKAECSDERTGIAPGGIADVDAATGATPGVAAACKELGMSSVADVTRELGIKPPGMA